jgi:hypothetical protein
VSALIVTVRELPIARLLTCLHVAGRADRSFREAVSFLAPLAEAPVERA